MKSNLVTASVLAISAVAIFGSASSFAQDSNYPGNEVSASATSNKTRADVRAELLQTPRSSYVTNSDNSYPAIDAAPAANTKTRAEVRAELEQAQREGYKLSVDNTYPVNTNVPGVVNSRTHSAG